MQGVNLNERKRKILLIEPPFYRLFKNSYSLDKYPLGLGYLACTIQEETNWKVQVYNADFNPQSESIQLSYLTGKGHRNYLDILSDLSANIWKEIQLTIKEFSPDVVGISAKSQNFKSACNVARIVKEINKVVPVIIGGPHPSIVGLDVLDCKDIDIGVIGEGEKTITELLNALEYDQQLINIKGVVFRNGNKFIQTAQRGYIKDLDTLCFPHTNAVEILKDYEQYPLIAYRSVFAVRGCPYKCNFCGSHKIWNRKVRFRSPENVIREIKKLQSLGLKFIHFDDDTFGINSKYIEDLCNLLTKKCKGIKWSCELHVKLVNEKNISLMKAAGCYMIQIGIESGNNEILKRIEKETTVNEIIAACKIIRKNRIKLHTFFMVGYPDETVETLMDTFKFMRRIKSDIITYSIFTPYLGTEIFDFCKENNLIKDDFDISIYNHQSPENCFCLHISPEKFRKIVSRIEKMVDRKNRIKRICRIFSVDVVRRLQELGIKRSIRIGANLLKRK